MEILCEMAQSVVGGSICGPGCWESQKKYKDGLKNTGDTNGPQLDCMKTGSVRILPWPSFTRAHKATQPRRKNGRERSCGQSNRGGSRGVTQPNLWVSHLSLKVALRVRKRWRKDEGLTGNQKGPMSRNGRQVEKHLHLPQRKR